MPQPAVLTQRQKQSFLVLGVVQVLLLLGMTSWMFLHAYRAVDEAWRVPTGGVLWQPLVWHKVGELMVVLPAGVPLAGFFMLWPSLVRRRYLAITTPFMIVGGLLNLAAAWGFARQPTTDFAAFMRVFGVLLFAAGVGLPWLLRWMHRKRALSESPTG